MDEELKDKIGDESYRVTQKGATEMPFSGKYLEEKRKGMYKCIVCGTDLFSADTKFNSGTGWPSFYDVANSKNVITKSDTSLGMKRIEVNCKKCDAHLGHLFEEGNDTPTGNRYCINSCSLDFNEEQDKE